jgi:hypothetical protein
VARRDGNTPEGWQMVLNNMVTLGAQVSPDEVKVVHQYLSSNFPDTAPKPVLVAGPIEVNIPPAEAEQRYYASLERPALVA